MEKFNKIKERGLRIAATVSSHHTGAFAAQAAYFFVLSLIPIFMLLLTMVQFTPVTKADVMEAALWSAGKGVLSVTYGLNCIYENTETRNYFYLRARACLYTFLFLVAIMLSLVLSVFGNSISVVVYEHAPLISKAIHKIIHLRIYFTLPLLTFFWDLVYKYLPNRGAEGKTTLRKQLPGAFFTACGWMALSFIFSIYLDIFKGFTNMYGSFTTIILVMLWLYTCMYIILLGGEINAILEGVKSRK